ncbi:MAG: hypothetical protein U0797_10895 [Gemmataceae bacterium]
MRSWISLPLGLALCGLVAVSAPASDPATVHKLIEQLGADSYADRDAASKALEKIGTPALEAILKATKSGDAEVRKRATELSGKLSRRAASEAVLAPKVVHLAFKGTPVNEAVKGLAEKSGYDVVLHDPEGKLKDKRVTLDTGKVTFWAALEKFCAAAGVVEGDPTVGSLTPATPRAPGAGPRAPAGRPAAPPPVAPVVPPPPKGKLKEGGASARTSAARYAVAAVLDVTEVQVVPAAVPPPGLPLPPKLIVEVGGVGLGYHGPVPPGRITLVPGEERLPADTTSSFRVRRADPKRFAAPPAGKEVAVLLEVSVEPRLSLQGLESVQVDAATDEHGQALTQVEPVAGSEGPGAGPVVLRGPRPLIIPLAAGAGLVGAPTSSNGLQVCTSLKLKRGEKESKSLTRLEGTITAAVLGGKEPMLVVESPAKAAGQAVKGKHGGEIHVTSVTKSADGAVQIEFEFDPPPAAQAETRFPAAEQAVGPPVRAGRAALPALMPGQTSLYTPWGLTLQDDKGNALPASIRPNFRKVGGSKAQFTATYLPGKDGKGEPARLAYTARRLTQVQVPFRLAGVEVK